MPLNTINFVSTAGLLLATNLFPASLAQEPSTNGSSSKLGAVASQSSVCSRIGTDLLQKGGSAVDAIVGTVLCVGTVSMYHSGIGGGGFALVRHGNGSYESVDFRDTAPKAAYQDMFKGNLNGSVYGGLEYIHSQYGRLPWADVVMPAANVARQGFTVTGDLIQAMGRVSPKSFLTEDPTWAIDFAPRGYRVRLGEVMTRQRYGTTLESIAKQGVDAFYTGSIANATITALKAANGTMTLEDLRTYKVAHRMPVSMHYRGYKLTSTNVPSSGVVALSALNTISGYGDFGNPAEVNQSAHRLIEAMKFAYGQRSKLGDPDFVSGMAGYTQNMVNPDTGNKLRAKISDFKTEDASWYDPDNTLADDTPGTSHMVAADASGMSVSLTTTINTHFGSLLMVPETGVVMNNQMDDFSIPEKNNSYGYVPNQANFIMPGKRPLSSISPVIVEHPDGRLYYAIGAAGGSRIISATIQNLIHVLDSGLTVPQALAQPRLHNQLRPSNTTFEYAYSNSTVSYIGSLGHNLTWVPPIYSLAQGVRLLPNGTFEAAGEPRQVDSGGYAV
ncbi:gamma-glutamyltranspeptidase [Purpureocillium lilacinum]|uniref:Glutathione hydrolase n=1 Tax=Purpureocillium lilacinum TaxID=33203 RepID=A0A179FBT4_PURLI|nr:gamma-glutamyltranspeptidase [Purpureocillium lilacinum]OAQ62533.1 gamma-glutamyltranspeptidase [Purpureocillium lilacinum]